MEGMDVHLYEAEDGGFVACQGKHGHVSLGPMGLKAATFVDAHHSIGMAGSSNASLSFNHGTSAIEDTVARQHAVVLAGLPQNPHGDDSPFFDLNLGPVHVKGWVDITAKLVVVEVRVLGLKVGRFRFSFDHGLKIVIRLLVLKSLVQLLR
ncbi:hypothetical protein B0T16DRAFT_389959 [Cercophora newfieldiana]|uniref:Uncharacterized protein n=1 Tax=Cercophora newfieldiana TaxID=92897 RepID=A0AA40CSM1_9PEZI|nr:hypothetical protein B0T16DRAFT_389959 [Cercophora newfieldiana]